MAMHARTFIKGLSYHFSLRRPYGKSKTSMPERDIKRKKSLVAVILCNT